MTAPSCVIYYGLRFAVPLEEVEEIETRRDWRVRAAMSAGLRPCLVNLNDIDVNHYLFIGFEIGILGPECLSELSLSLDALRETIRTTDDKLAESGLPGVPALHFQFQEDL